MQNPYKQKCRMKYYKNNCPNKLNLQLNYFMMYTKNADDS